MGETIHGTRRVGEQVLQSEDDPSMILLGVPFLGCDTFRVPEPGHPTLPPVGTTIRVEERGWWWCPCCQQHQPHLRGRGVGVIECHTSGQFHFYVVEPEAPPLLPQRPADG